MCFFQIDPDVTTGSHSVKTYSVFSFAIIFACLAPIVGRAQDSPVGFSGQLQLSGEGYSSNGIPLRRERFVSRAIFRSTITVYDQIVLPFEAYWTTHDRGFRQPFNQFGASPKFFGWLTVHGGYYSAKLSDFTFGETRVFGGGVQAEPGDFRFAVLHGRIQKATEPDSARGFGGAYRRMMIAGRLGYGREDEFFVTLNVMKAWDDSSSIHAISTNPPPAENLAASFAFSLPLFDQKFTLRSEVAMAAFTSDVRSQELTTGTKTWKSLFTPRTSSQIDGAGKVTLQLNASEAFSVGLTGHWVGPGYVTLGYPQLPNDVLDLILSPTLRMMQGALTMRLSGGVRYNNLRNNRHSTTRRSLVNIVAAYQPNSIFGVDVQYANHGVRSTHRNDTLKINNIAQSLAVSPRVMFEALGGQNTTMASYNLQDFSDNNILGSTMNNNQTQSATVLWSIAFPSTLSLTTTYNYTSSKTSMLATRINSVTGTVGYLLFDALSLSITGGYNRVMALSTDGQFTGSLNANYTLGRAGTISLTVMTNRYDYENIVAGNSYSETQGSLQYSLAL